MDFNMGDDMLAPRMEDLAKRAVKEGFAASRFLTPAQAEAVAMQFARRRDAGLTFEGGFSGAERVRAVFTNPEWGDYDYDSVLAALRIEYRRQDMLGHRDILGALMALGLERDTIGDIAADGPPVTLVCLPELSGFIAENLTKAGRVGLHVSRIKSEELPDKTETPREKTETVASLRLDAVLCACFDISRSEAAGLIAAGRISLDHLPCLQPSKELMEGSILSARGLGRAKLLEIGGTSRKGRIFLRLGLYGR